MPRVAPRIDSDTARRVGREARSRGVRLEKLVARWLPQWRSRGLELWLVGAHTYPIGAGKARYSGLTPESRMVDLVGRFLSVPVCLDIKGTSEAQWRMTARTLPESERDALSRMDGCARYAFAGLLICTNEDTQPRWELRRLLCGVQSGLYEDPANLKRVALANGLESLPDAFSFLLHGIRPEARTPATEPLRAPAGAATFPDGASPNMWREGARPRRVVARGATSTSTAGVP